MQFTYFKLPPTKHLLVKLLQGWKPNYRARFVIFWTDHFSGLRREMSADKYCQTICVQKPNVIFPCVNNKTDQLVSLKFSLLVDGQFYSFVMFFFTYLSRLLHSCSDVTSWWKLWEVKENVLAIFVLVFDTDLMNICKILYVSIRNKRSGGNTFRCPNDVWV